MVVDGVSVEGCIIPYVKGKEEIHVVITMGYRKRNSSIIGIVPFFIKLNFDFIFVISLLFKIKTNYFNFP